MERKYNPDNIFMRGMTLVYQMMVLNALFILTSLAMVTIGASTKALYFSMRDLFKKELSSEVRTYFKYFKDDFVKSTGAFILLLLGYGIVLVNFMYLRELGNVGWLLTAIQVPVFIQILLIHAYVFIVRGVFSLTVMASIKVAWVIGNRNIVKVVGSLFCMYMLFKLGLRIPLILMFFFFSFAAALHYIFLQKTVEALILKSDQEVI